MSLHHPTPQPLSRLNIVPPLRNHPNKTPRRHKHRPRKRLPPPRRPEDKPLAAKVRKRNDIRPNRELVERGLIDVVRSIEPYNRRQERPGPERPARQPGYVRGLLDRRVDRRWVVQARRVRQRRVGLDRV